MVRRRRVLSALVVVLCCLAPAFALGDNARVFDRSDLFTASEKREIEETIALMRDKYQMDFVVLTDGGARYSSDDDEAGRYSMDYADVFYENGGFGSGPELDGFLYFIDMSNRLPTISTTGAMIDYVTDSRLERLLNLATDRLRLKGYGQSALDVLSQLAEYLDQGVPEGQYRYDLITGKRLTARHKALTLAEMLVSALIAIAVGGIWALSVHRSYRLKGGAYRYDLKENSSFQPAESRDDYLTTTVTKVRRPDPSSGGGGGGSSGGGSGVHTSSGGGSHGGGSGGRF